MSVHNNVSQNNNQPTFSLSTIVKLLGSKKLVSIQALVIFLTVVFVGLGNLRKVSKISNLDTKINENQKQISTIKAETNTLYRKLTIRKKRVKIEGVLSIAYQPIVAVDNALTVQGFNNSIVTSFDNYCRNRRSFLRKSNIVNQRSLNKALVKSANDYCK